LLEPVTVGPEEFEDAAAEFARSVQIVSRLPDQFLISESSDPRSYRDKPAAFLHSSTNL
jgi:hypothetical protein